MSWRWPWRREKKQETRFPGITLAPGEATAFDIPISPDLAALIERGEARLTLQHEDMRCIGENRYQRTEVILLNGEPYARIGIEWNGKDADLRLEDE